MGFGELFIFFGWAEMVSDVFFVGAIFFDGFFTFVIVIAIIVYKLF